MLGENIACATVSLHPYILDDAHVHQELKVTNSQLNLNSAGKAGSYALTTTYVGAFLH